MEGPGGLYLYEAGPEDAPAIVFLHGTGLSGRMWQAEMDLLPEYHCLAPDLPEQGRSAHLRPFLLEDAARRASELIAERAAGGRAHVVGISLGGAVGLTLMRLAPERIDHLMVSGPPARIGPLMGTIMLAVGGLIYRLIKPETLIRDAAREFDIPPEGWEVFERDMLPTVTPEFNADVTRALMDLVVPREAVVPTLVAVGGEETAAAKRAARKLVSTMRGARGVIVPEAGHVWNLQDPDLFNRTVRAWITDRLLPHELSPLR